MIFVTVGTQLPFDRMVRAVDEWAARHGRSDVVAQVGDTAARFPHIQTMPRLDPAALRATMEQADVVIAHAGIGSIVTAIELGKPVIVMPRRSELREHRNDHQLATCQRFAPKAGVRVAEDEHELGQCLDAIAQCYPAAVYPLRTPTELTDKLRAFVNGGGEGVRGGPAWDGVICFGGVDWWYHNRGHYDIQMMREVSGRMPVLYVNSLGMRTPCPSEGSMFLRRVMRKLRSVRSGCRKVRRNFGVFSPLSAPRLLRSRLGRMMAAAQVRWAARRMGIRRPLIWVACPTAAELLDAIPAAGVVYQRTDRFEHFPGVDRERIAAYDAFLKQESDLTLFCSSMVYEEEREHCRSALFVDHGVDYEDFARAGREAREPEDVRDIPRPRVGFVGGIDAHTFDPELFLSVARAMPDHAFVMVGACSLPEGWCEPPNVHLLGQRDYSQVPRYMAACDVLIMPWNRSDWIQACNPVKLKEYLAVGRPVVSTPFAELQRYEADVYAAEDAEAFVAAIRTARSEAPPADQLRRRVERETWETKAKDVADGLDRAGVPARAEAAAGDAAAASAGASPEGSRPPVNPGGGGRVSTGFAGARAWPIGGSIVSWARMVMGIAFAAAGLYITRDAWGDMFAWAMKDEENSHILLVPLVVAWLVWVRRRWLSDCPLHGTWIGPAILAAGWALYSLGDTHLVQSFWHAGAIAVAVGCLLAFTGRGLLMRLMPAFVVLVFLIPIPGMLRQQIAMPLQTTTAQATQFLLSVLGVGVERSGNVLVVNGVQVAVAEACNGLRMVFAVTLVSYLYAFGTALSPLARFSVLVASPVLAILCNILRLIPTAWVYGYQSQAVADAFHDVSGWLMMPVALLLLMGGAGVARWVLQPGRTEAPRGRAPSTPATA